MAQWADFPIDKALFTNADETILSNANAAMENCYMNEAGGQSRWPGRKPFVRFSGTKTYLSKWRNNLIAVTDEGRVFRIDEAGNMQDVTGVPISGGQRVTFAKTEDELVMAAGAEIIRLANDRTEILSEDAPLATHVGYIDGYLLANERFSGRFFRSDVGQYRKWDLLAFFTASGQPDDVTALVVTPYRELLLAGQESIEQWEPVTGQQPFARRWSSGEGIEAPYTLISTDDGTFGINPLREFIRYNQQVAVPESNAIGGSLEALDDLSEAWCARIHIKGQKFIVLVAPNATNPYGTTGFAAAFDYRARRWNNLYDLDQDTGIAERWIPWSHQQIWGRHFVGVAGGVQELTPKNFCGCNVDGQEEIVRMLVRTGHVDKWNRSRIDNFRLRLRRGTTGNQDDPIARVGLRVNKDNKGFGRWKFKSLGRFGQREMVIEFGALGSAFTWQMEYMITDPVASEIVNAKALVERLGW